ncbi:MAG: response regulator transcription factor [Planctomycetaceae bacterium]|nr:response regulator transcription factor [Planctomycetaceae bacterium]
MLKQSVLVVEDDEDIRELVSYNLLKEGYQVASVASGEDALQAVAAKPPDLVLLDLMLPGLDGLTVCRRLKSDPATQHFPVIMLTAKGEEADVVTGLNLGADDYITKPFSPKVLLARIQAVFRRAAGAALPADIDDDQPPEVTESHGLKIHAGRHEVSINGAPVDLTATEFKLLHFLAQRPGWVFTRQQILDAVRGDIYAATDRAVDVQVVGLRRKLGPAGTYIETVRGVGYRFKE